MKDQQSCSGSPSLYQPSQLQQLGNVPGHLNWMRATAAKWLDIQLNPQPSILTCSHLCPALTAWNSQGRSLSACIGATGSRRLTG